jgi:choline dehydrogenase
MRIVTPDSISSNYDYIIVGSGPAGSIIASQLQDVGRVLVLEAGSMHRGPFSHVPAHYPRSFGSRIDWNYQTTPQPNLAHRRFHWPSGKTIGGSSAINAMIRIEPALGCLEQLEHLGGVDWSIGSMLAAFGRLRSLWQGTLPELHPNISSVLARAMAHDVGTAEGLIRPGSKISPYVRMQSAGKRQTIRHLVRCDVIADAMVNQLVIESDRVTGLLADVEGTRISVRANKQIILCCGAIQTPKLLFQSGIGPKGPLMDAGVDCNYPVERIGVGLQDHLVYPLVFRLRSGQAFSLPFSKDERLRYIREGKGAKSSNLAELGAFIDPTDTSQHAFQWHITPTHYLAYPNIPAPYPCISVGITQCKPASLGTILPLPCASQGDRNGNRISLRIDPGYLSDEGDRQATIHAIHTTREFFRRGIWDDLIEEEIAPGPKRVTSESLASHFERFATTLYHYSSTCPMGVDPTNPVDPRFKLRGIDGLRICDASVFPKILGCNPQTTIMMLAMRLGDWLLDES